MTLALHHALLRNPLLDRGRLISRMLLGEPSLPYLTYLPQSAGPRAPILTVVHGIERDADACAHAFMLLSEACGAVLLLPRFEFPGFEDYARLGRAGLGARADRALDRMAAEVASLTGARLDRMHLFGSGAGAQFAHRYALAHPRRVAGAVPLRSEGEQQRRDGATRRALGGLTGHV